MTRTTARFSRQEISRRGHDIFERQIRPTLGIVDDNKFVAIDIESADFELDRDDFTATARLRQRQKDAQIWLMRVGAPGAYQLGGRLDKESAN